MTIRCRSLLVLIFLTALNGNHLQAKEVVHSQGASQSQQVATTTQYAFSQEGEPKYPMGFTHFDYANPDAPKGGTFKRAVIQSGFTTFNPNLPSCDNDAPGSRNLFGSLMTWALDDYNTLYPSIAKSIQIADDKSFVILNLNENAVFNDPTNDGCDPKKPAKREKVTADDVKFSFESLKEYGYAGAQSYFKDIESVEVLDDKRVKFTINPEKWKSAIPAAAGLTIYSKAYHSNKVTPFNRCSRDPIPGTGAYIVEGATDQTIKYKRVCNHWAEKVPTGAGHNNFDHLQYDLHREIIGVEGAFRTRQSDTLNYIRFNQWPDDLKNVDKGTNMFQDSKSREALERKEISLHQLSTPYDGSVIEMSFNSANPNLKDRRVRKALSLLYEPEYQAEQLAKNQSQPSTTYFPAAKPELASEQKVKELLERQKEKHGDRFPEDAFKNETPVDRKGKSYSDIFRERAREADRLMKEAGWRLQVDPDGSGQQVWMKGQKKFPKLQVPTPNPSQYVVYKSRLHQFGIDVELRQVGVEQLTQIETRNQYDLATRWIRHDPVPGPELSGLWGSESARKTEGSKNLTRTSSPVIDDLMDVVVNAKTRQDRQVAIEALNRVMKAEHPSILLPRAKSSIYLAKRNNVGGVGELPTTGRIPTAAVPYDTWWDKTLKPGTPEK